MRVLLVYANLKDDILAAPPIGLSYVACATQAAGHTVNVLDLCFQKKWMSVLTSRIEEFRPEVIGISIRNIDNVNLLHPKSYLPEVKRIIETIRNTTSIPLVIGGSGASMCPAEVLSELKADFIIVSDGEQSFVDLLDALATGRTANDIPGLGQNINGIFSLIPPRLKEFKKGNAELGKWVDMKNYQNVGSSYVIQTKRGCPQKCIYCTYNQVLEGNRLRLRSPVDVVDEIEEAIKRYRADCIEFVDSVFNFPLDHCTEILEEILSRSLRVTFTAMGVSPKNLDDKLLSLMWRAGFTSFMISPESASADMIRNYKKGFTVDDLVCAAEALSKTRFTALWFFLIGGPGENNSTLDQSLKFILKYLNQPKPPPYSMANLFLGVRLYPGTELWKIALEEGVIHLKSNPLKQLWYVSKNLDLKLAFNQMTEAAKRCPGIILGFDEKHFSFSSKLATWMGKIIRMPKPYWRHGLGYNRILLWTGLRFFSARKSLLFEIQGKLDRQISG